MNAWHGLHLIEPAVALGLLALMKLVPLPPSQRGKAFEKLDFVTIGLAIPAMLLLCGVLGLGRVYWWHDAPFLGWMLAAGLPLLALALLIETHRRRPLLQMDWLTSADILRFAVVALLVRLALAEQTYGSVGLLTSGGLDQRPAPHPLQPGGMFDGAGHDRRVAHPVAGEVAPSGGGRRPDHRRWGVPDSSATNLSRPPQLYLSQSLLGFGTTLFIGPALVFGFLRMIKERPSHLVSFMVLFNVTQNVGGLRGLSPSGQLPDHPGARPCRLAGGPSSGSDPQVIQRIQAGAGCGGRRAPDPALRSAEGGALLGQSLAQEANILAYNDVFRLVTLLALTTAAYLFYRMAWLAYQARRDRRMGVAR